MEIFRTPAQRTDYNLKLTKEEVRLLSLEGEVDESLKACIEFFNLIDREAKKLGDKQSTARP